VRNLHAHATQFVALHDAPEILHRVAMKNFHAIRRKICCNTFLCCMWCFL